MKHVHAKDKSKVMDDLNQYIQRNYGKNRRTHICFSRKVHCCLSKAIKVLTEIRDYLLFIIFLKALIKILKEEPYGKSSSQMRIPWIVMSTVRIHKGFAQASAEINEFFD